MNTLSLSGGKSTTIFAIVQTFWLFFLIKVVFYIKNRIKTHKLCNKITKRGAYFF